MATGLVEEIQKAAIDPKVPVSTLLRQVKLAAVKLKLETVESWVDAELNGYDDGQLPAYRKVKGAARARSHYGGWQPLILDKDTELSLGWATVGNSIAHLEALLASRDDGSLIRHYSAAVLRTLSKHNDDQIVEGGCVIDRSNMAGILDAVRNLVLDWAIGLERVGVIGNGISFSAQEQKQAHEAGASVITIGDGAHITGNIGTANVARDIISRPLDFNEVRNLIDQVRSHADALAAEGVDRGELVRAVDEVEKQLPTKNETRMRKALNGLRGLLGKTADKVVTTGVATMIVKMLGL